MFRNNTTNRLALFALVFAVVALFAISHTAHASDPLAACDRHLSLVELEVGEVVKLTQDQRRSLGPVFSGGRQFIVTGVDLQNGKASLRAVSKHALNKSRREPILLAPEDSQVLSFDLNTFSAESKVGRASVTAVRSSPTNQSAVDALMSDLRQYGEGDIVRVASSNELWLIRGRYKKNGGSYVRYNIVNNDNGGLSLSNEKHFLVSDGSSKSYRVHYLGKGISPQQLAYRGPGFKYLGQNFSVGTVFKYLGQSFVVDSAQSGSFSEQGARPQATWVLGVAPLSEVSVAKLLSGVTIGFTPRLNAMEVMIQSGGWHFYGEFRGRSLDHSKIEVQMMAKFQPRPDKVLIKRSLKLEAAAIAQAKANDEAFVAYFSNYQLNER